MGYTMKFDILNGLNKEQIEAVTSTERYIRVIAGAGTRFIFNINKKYLKYNIKLQHQFINSSKNFISNSEKKLN